jgi:Ca2+-binding RTX toxin-like protein
LLFGSAEGRAATNTAGQSITNNPGSTFTLTTSPDNLTGTTGNDTFNGVIDTAIPANSTLTSADVINGGAGTDTLIVTVVGNNTSVIPGGAQLTSIEVIGVRNFSTGINNVATVTAPTGLTLVEARDGSGDVTVNGLAQGARFEAKATTGGAMTVNYVAAATQAQLGFFGANTDSVTVVGTGVTSAVITTGTAASTITSGSINFTGSNNLQTVTINADANLNTSVGGITITPTVGGIATLNVNGAAANVNVGTLDADFATVNASGMTAGGLTATISNLAVNITGGAGNDVITTGGVLTGTVNAGAGTGDRLIVTDSAHISAALGARYTGFEVLQANDRVLINATHVAGITDLILNGGSGGPPAPTGFTSVSAAQAARVQMLGAGTNDLTIAVTGASNPGQIDTVTITVSDNLAAVNTIILGGNLVLAGVENLNLVLTDNYVQNSHLVAGAPALATVTLSGAGTANLTTGAITTANFTINGASATGSLTLDGALATVGVRFDGGSAADTLTGSAHADILNGGAGADIIFGGGGNDIINGGDGNDTITGGAGADTLTGGAGADTFVYTNLADSLVANFDTIVDFVAGTDKIDIPGVVAGVQQGAAYTAAGTGSLATDINTAINTGSGGVGLLLNHVAVVTITGTGAGTYLVINDNTLGYQAGSDAVIRITGLTGTLSVADFV